MSNLGKKIYGYSKRLNGAVVAKSALRIKEHNGSMTSLQSMLTAQAKAVGK